MFSKNKYFSGQAQKKTNNLLSIEVEYYILNL